MYKFARSRKGFTLIEIMIVVLIIGILLAIAVPNFVTARKNSRQKACIANLKQIDAAKDQWAMANNKKDSDTPDEAALGTYIKKYPTCPSGGDYTIGTVGEAASCSIHKTADDPGTE